MNQPSLPKYDPKMWFQYNAPLLAALSQPADYGFPTSGELIAAVARENQISPRALTKQLEAGRFLRTTYKHLIDDRPMLGGYSQTEYLQKIHALSPERAEALAEKVISGEISMSAIRQSFDEAMAATGGGGSVGSMARRRVVEFQTTCGAVLTQDMPKFCSIDGAALVAGYKLNGYSLDYAVIQEGRVLVAVECRIGGMRASLREAFDLVTTLAMLSRQADSACLLLPQSAKDLADSALETASHWRVERIWFGLVTEGPTPSLTVHRPQVP